jgi:hypothetical protein
MLCHSILHSTYNTIHEKEKSRFDPASKERVKLRVLQFLLYSTLTILASLLIFYSILFTLNAYSAEHPCPTILTSTLYFPQMTMHGIPAFIYTQPATAPVFTLSYHLSTPKAKL